MLLILVMLTVVVSACAALARLAVESSVARTLALQSDLCRDLLGVCDDAITKWLQSESGNIVLPPDVTEPRIEVLSDVIELDGVSLELRITAWDQNGMVPLSHTIRGSLLRNVLPQSIIREVDAARATEGQRLSDVPGLDLFDVNSVFPMPIPIAAAQLGSASTPSLSEVGPRRFEPSLGAFVATHNPSVATERGRRNRRMPSAINVNTAPLPLVEAAMRMAGRRGIQQIEKARQAGKPSLIGNESLGKPVANAPQLVTTSNAWAFRIDVAAGPVRRSWWSVFVQNRGSWVCVQRLDILQ